MVRSFATEPIASPVLDGMLDLARRAPSAGNSQAVSFLTLEDDAVALYWDTTLPATRRSSFRWQGLLDAPVLVVLTTRPGAYVERYAEPDKARAGLGDHEDGWPVPFWWVDAGAVAQNLLLLTVERGLGACLFGIFHHEAAVKRAFGVPDEERLVCTVALGHPLPDEPGRSAGRTRPPLEHVRHRNRWRHDGL